MRGCDTSLKAAASRISCCRGAVSRRCTVAASAPAAAAAGCGGAVPALGRAADLTAAAARRCLPRLHGGLRQLTPCCGPLACLCNRMWAAPADSCMCAAATTPVQLLWWLASLGQVAEMLVEFLTLICACLGCRFCGEVLQDLLMTTEMLLLCGAKVVRRELCDSNQYYNKSQEASGGSRNVLLAKKRKTVKFDHDPVKRCNS